MEDSSAGRTLPLKFDAIQLLLIMDGDPNGTVIMFSPVSQIYDYYVCSGGRFFGAEYVASCPFGCWNETFKLQWTPGDIQGTGYIPF